MRQPFCKRNFWSCFYFRKTRSKHTFPLNILRTCLITSSAKSKKYAIRFRDTPRQSSSKILFFRAAGINWRQEDTRVLHSGRTPCTADAGTATSFAICVTLWPLHLEFTQIFFFSAGSSISHFEHLFAIIYLTVGSGILTSFSMVDASFPWHL